MKMEKMPIEGYELAHLKQDADGLVDSGYYEARGRQLQAQAIGDIFRQAGRYLARYNLIGLAK
ncbi:MAG: hypothetical protein HN725_06260 [Alphaproteobacteria bacterium]|jgi:hypothetical protein|nr:hypothetical protein [Alphaproteobacteria bacterium]MBT4086250.1 hypothetical protein [Alphaproteobacteria bacterium]MBT4543867.1 hypothetical protein [Alphaproteobacteria bacterium]MBT7744878.1 hypothetical protein [Alphaproteobacteria bacterium]